MNKTKIAGAVVMLAALSQTVACGSGEDAAPKPPQAEPTQAQVLNAPTYTEAEVAEGLGLDELNYVNVNGTKCEAAVVMTDANMVDMYASAGDLVVTNAAGDVGVKVVGDKDGTCMIYFMEKLMQFN